MAASRSPRKLPKMTFFTALSFNGPAPGAITTTATGTADVPVDVLTHPRGHAVSTCRLNRFQISIASNLSDFRGGPHGTSTLSVLQRVPKPVLPADALPQTVETFVMGSKTSFLDENIEAVALTVLKLLAYSVNFALLVQSLSTGDWQC
jgi:hypothetical protein